MDVSDALLRRQLIETNALALRICDSLSCRYDRCHQLPWCEREDYDESVETQVVGWYDENTAFQICYEGAKYPGTEGEFYLELWHEEDEETRFAKVYSVEGAVVTIQSFATDAQYRAMLPFD